MAKAKFDRTVDEKRVFEIIKPIIDKNDPEILLKMGCPTDEYDPESRMIAEAIVGEGGNRLNAVEIANIINLVFHYMFRPWSEPVMSLPETYIIIGEKIRKEILSNLPELGGLQFRK